MLTFCCAKPAKSSPRRQVAAQQRIVGAMRDTDRWVGGLHVRNQLENTRGRVADMAVKGWRLGSVAGACLRWRAWNSGRLGKKPVDGQLYFLGYFTLRVIRWEISQLPMHQAFNEVRAVAFRSNRCG